MTLLLALLLDAIAGEPRWLWQRFPHPAVLMGRCVGWIDDTFNTGASRKIKGAASFAGLVCAAYILGLLLAAIPGAIVDLLILAILLAQRSLVDHVRAVADGLRLSVGDGRNAVAMIVSRDTRTMDKSAVARSAIESGAENMSDGITAPVFWFAVLGLPGLLVYKITNTADSMIGYKTPRHADFGWAAARFDDLLNYIPARLTAALMMMVTPDRPSWSAIAQDAGKHLSPNAGWPEAAMAHGHNIALAGPRSYHGTTRDLPFVNANGRIALTADDIDASITTLWKTWGLLVVAAVIIALF
ncbi:adenosylcobinamide-phosphate synthase CbiB [Yoonia sp. 208BN28-4]|uniref:adenosylcobinamide-phosphate synthase CbiB n=1 Tax=Yoonia sp. 208BN28-4 TaxID=3126505 RepID=UPI00309D59B2